MWELYHGGWLAPNIYYLGGSGCVRLNGIRIAGASGIFKDHDYNLGHYERIPFDNSSLRSVYHVRAHDVLKLSLLSPGPEVFISHDWPEGIYRHGDTAALLRTKPFFKPDIEKGELGNPHMMDVLKLLRPLWWFSAHLHVRFAAEYDHTGQGVSDWSHTRVERQNVSLRKAPVKNSDEIIMDDDEETPGAPIAAPQSTTLPVVNTNEIIMDDEENDAPEAKSDGPVAATPATNSAEPEPLASSSMPNTTENQLDSVADTGKHLPSTTKFLALDKCVPRRKFLEIIDTPSPQDHSPPKLTYDIEWLAISKAMHPLLSTDRKTNIQPRINMAQRWVEKELEWVKEKIINLKRSAATTNDPTNQDNEELEVETIQQFVMTASGPNRNINPRQQPSWYTNPQTEAFCALIEVENKVNPAPKDQMAAGPLK